MPAPEEPRTAPDQAEGLRRSARPEPVKVITVTGGKGGVGKTNICANLAVAMSMLGRRVMLLDGGSRSRQRRRAVRPAAAIHHGRRRARRALASHEIVVTGPAGRHGDAGRLGPLRDGQPDQAQNAGIVNAFSELTCDLDVLLVDTPAGISDTRAALRGGRP